MQKETGTEFRETGRKGLPETPVIKAIGTVVLVGHISPNMNPVQS